jgi:hypothetical protein
MTFYGSRADRPPPRRFGEDHLVEKTATRSRFTWTIAMAPTAKTARLLRIGSPLNRLLLRCVPIHGKAYFARHP